MENIGNMGRLGIIGSIAVLLAALWMLAAYYAYEESQRAKYTVEIKPGNVHYGTRSTVTAPAVFTSSPRSSMPVISGSAIRSYAHSGHASMPAESAGANYRMHTTSSATAKTIGSGYGNGGGFAVQNGNSGSSTSRGIIYSGASVSIPSLAMVMPQRSAGRTSSFAASDIAAAPQRGIGIRRMPGYAGDEYGDVVEDGGKYWFWDGEGWLENGDVAIGTTKVEGGITYRWNGSAWEIVSDQQDPGMPVGDTPWMLFALLMAVYAALRIRKRQGASIG